MRKKITQPHDAFIKSCLTDMLVAKDLIISCISTAVAQQVDWSTLAPANSNLIKKELKQLQTDLLFTFRYQGETASHFFLIEHQRIPDRFLAFRFMNYNVTIMDRSIKQLPKFTSSYLPEITNICVCACAKEIESKLLDICYCFAQPRRVRQTIKTFNPILLKDLTATSEEALLACGQADLVYILLKAGVRRDFLPLIRDRSQTFVKLFDRPYVETGIIYILEVDEQSSPQELLEAIIQVEPKKENIIMSAAQQLRQEGRYEGMQEGMQKGIQNRNITIAKNMLKKGYSIDLIQEITELPKASIVKIKRDQEQ
jgi:predicted transposase YdaD